MRFGMWAAAAAALVCSGHAQAARYLEFQIRGAAVVTAYANPQDAAPFTAKFDDTITVGFDTLGANTGSYLFNSGGGFTVYLDQAAGSIFSMTMPGGPAFSLTYNAAQIATGAALIPMNVTGSFGYTYCARSCGTTVPGTLLSFAARATDVAPASLRLIEQLEVTPVPEPASWAMLIFGMGVVGFALRRRHPFPTDVYA